MVFHDGLSLVPMTSRTILCAILACMAGTLCSGQQMSPPAILPSSDSVQEAILRANDYFLANDTTKTNGWARGAYHTGNMAAYQLLGVERYVAGAIAWATTNGWQPGVKGGTNADGEVCGQTYIDLYRLDPQPIRIAAMKSAIDGRVASAAAVQDWWWIDAFYMAAPVFARFGDLYATNSYFDKMWLMYDDMKTRLALFDPSLGLWYRDAVAQTAVTKNGKKQIWGRGNGWVLAALPRVLEFMPPSHPHRGDLIAMLQTMAAALKPLQGADGMWRSSLLDPAEFPNPETSGTALFTYGMAWGIRNGYLDSADYLPVVARAWNGMITNALHTNGLVGYVQAQGRIPDAATYDSTSDFGVGVFVLAGTEVLRLAGGAPTIPVITVQPASQGVPVGAAVTFGETAIGTPPLRYQWLKDGGTLAGATNNVLTIASVQTNQSGNYLLVVNNAYGSVTSVVAALTVLTLPIALNTPNWTWTSGGSAPWTAQPDFSHDGVGALQSGVIGGSQTSWVQTAISGPATVTFWWKVSSETNKDLLRLTVNGTEQMRISGEEDWQFRSLDLAAGTNVLRWVYSKNSSTVKGLDRGWLDQVGIVCGYSLASAGQAYGFQPATGQISVIASNSLCAWSVLNTNDWITISSNFNGAGQGVVDYSLAANPTAIARTGVVMIAGQIFAISQSGAPCFFSLWQGARVHSYGSETGLVGITTIPGCGWMASTTNDWISLFLSTNGTDSGIVGYVVAANPAGIARTGAILVAGQNYGISQAGAPCRFELSPTSRLHGPGGETGSVSIVTIPGCNWVVQNTNDWITFASSTNGTGAGGITYLLATNSSWLARIGVVSIAGQSFTITNLGTIVLNCPLDKMGDYGSDWDFGQPTAVTGCPDTNIMLQVANTVTNTSGFCGKTFSVTRTWEAVDGCSNRATCNQTVTVVDHTPPLVRCLDTKGVACGAAWSFDDPVAFDAVDGTNLAVRVLGTATNGNCGQAFVATRTWMIADQCGNSATCSQTVTNIQRVIQGVLSYATNYPSLNPSDLRLAGVGVGLSGDGSQRTQTAADGSYSFTVYAGGNFTVTPDLPASDPPVNGITTTDIVLIRRHILNVGKLSSPYKLLSADVNGSESVTTSDVVKLRQLILGLTNSLPAGLWRVVPSDYVFPDVQNPWGAPEGRSYTNLVENRTGQDFLAIKMGDVNNSWSPVTAARSVPAAVENR